jgi:hypothetical protein
MKNVQSLVWGNCLGSLIGKPQLRGDVEGEYVGKRRAIVQAEAVVIIHDEIVLGRTTH